jgi:hypothetical protein
MNDDESKKLAKNLSDRSRKVTRVGRQFIVPHKFTPSGDVVTQENFSAQTCLSKLNLADLRFLALWKENKWDDGKTAEAAGLSPEQAEKTLKKLRYFKTEDARIRALAAEATPERVLAKDMENMETGLLNDSQHKSLDRVAKITGAFKTAAEINIQQNIFNLPKMSPEAEAALRAIADREADMVEGELA